MLASILRETAEETVKQLVNTHSDSVLSTLSMSDASSLQLFLRRSVIFHMNYFATKRMTRMVVRTTVTDVVVPAVANAQTIAVTEIWVAFGIGKNFNYIPEHQVACQLVPCPASANV